MFEGKNIIITGGSSGLGEELAYRLAAKGANLALVARDQARLQSVVKNIPSAADHKIRVEAFQSDVCDPSSVEQTGSRIAETIGIPDILINSAGIISENYFEKLPLETFQKVMDTNFFGTLYWIKAVLPYFQQKGQGRIVNICSMAGLMGTFGYSPYCSSKHAVTGLTQSLRVELKPQNIRFHLVCPAEFTSPMVDQLNTYRTAENRKIVQTIPVLSLEKVADEVIRGIEKDKYLIIPGAITRLFEILNRYFPYLTRRTSDLIIRQCYKGPKE
ncbi:MAG: SDR family oxidoreductase [Pseudomonadota bacterium]